MNPEKFPAPADTRLRHFNERGEVELYVCGGAKVVGTQTDAPYPSDITFPSNIEELLNTMKNDLREYVKEEVESLRERFETKIDSVMKEVQKLLKNGECSPAGASFGKQPNYHQH